MTGELMAVVEPDGISAQKPVHSGGEAGRRGFHHQVKVVAQEAESVNLPAGFQAHLSQGLDELLPVNLIMVDGLSPVPPARSRYLSELARDTYRSS